MHGEGRVAILATGDEILAGDILNTTTQAIAAQCHDLGLTVAKHLCVGDIQTEIKACIDYLLQDHQVLIITGGLGPTSDDLTRFALAEYLNRPLEFNQASWARLCDRLKAVGLSSPDNNRQQCLFPQQADIIINTRGTADGCYVQFHDQHIFMLPGPPHECDPMLIQFVLPKLAALPLQHHTPLRRWLLLGVSEGHIAAKIEQILANTPVSVGYRASYPYLEIKIRGTDQDTVNQVEQELDKLLANHLVGRSAEKASDKLRHWIIERQQMVFCHDAATRGLLESLLTVPENAHLLHFQDHEEADENSLRVTIEGLKPLWQQQPCHHTDIDITISHRGSPHHIQKTLPYRHYRTRELAVEIVCWELYQYLSRSSGH